MKIRTQNIWIVVPLFLAVAGLIGALMLFVQQRELKWGAEEEVSSIALAVARHLDPSLFEGEAAPWPERTLQRIIQWDRARHLSLWSTDGKRIFTTRESSAGPDATPPAGADQGGWLIEPMQTLDDGRAILRAWSAVRRDDSPVGYVMVETSAEDVLTATAQIRGHIKRFIILTGCSGFILAWMLSGLISRRLRELTQTARRAADGHYDVRHKAEGIQEISDLGNTVNTMTSVLGEVVSKSRRVIVEAEQFRTERDLEQAYASQFFALRSATLDHMDVSGSLLGPCSAGHFFGFWTSAKGYSVAITGHIDKEAGLASGVKAAAVIAALEELTALHPWPQAVTIWRGLFAVPWATALVWESGSDALRRFAVTGTHNPMTEEQLERPRTNPILIHSIPEDKAGRLATYLATYAKQSPGTLVAEMQRIAPSEVPGAVIVLKGAQR